MESIIDSLYLNKELYTALFTPVCNKYKITMTEMLVLLFLSKNTNYDTASDIVNKLKITKSHISASVRDLEERGYVHGNHTECNHRTIHLHVCDSANDLIRDGKHAQKEFLSVITAGFSAEEIKTFADYIKRMNENANSYLNGKRLETMYTHHQNLYK